MEEDEYAWHEPSGDDEDEADELYNTLSTCVDDSDEDTFQPTEEELYQEWMEW